jgi:predicted anti-sigma-YlaC factor YlaD
MIMYSCKEMAEKSLHGDFDNAGWWTRMLVNMHMAMCKHCQRFSAQMKFIARAVKEKAEKSVTPSELAAFKRRLKDRLAD